MIEHWGSAYVGYTCQYPPRIALPMQPALPGKAAGRAAPKLKEVVDGGVTELVPSSIIGSLSAADKKVHSLLSDPRTTAQQVQQRNLQDPTIDSLLSMHWPQGLAVSHRSSSM